jgi:ribosome-binding protein aMBF1 (putative translation factor)
MFARYSIPAIRALNLSHGDFCYETHRGRCSAQAVDENPAYRREYGALAEEFALASALLEARGRAGLTQAQVARRMKTTQTAIARLEGGRVKPSTRTLERYARATGHRLVIGFEPVSRKVKAKEAHP